MLTADARPSDRLQTYLNREFERFAELELEKEEVSSKLEAEFEPTQGTFSRDLNDNKALTGRIALRPSPNHDVAISGDYGRYTPDFLIDEDVWSPGFDGLHKVGGMELEYQVIRTDRGNTARVAESFAAAAKGG